MYYVSMKISKITNTILFAIALLTFAGFFSSCGSSKVAAPTSEPAVEEKPAPTPEEPKVEEPKVEEAAPAIEEPAPIQEEPVPVVEEPVAEEPKADDEYSRSVGDIQISRDTFIDDKEKVLQIISELATIMKNMDYNFWLGYVEPASIDYWKLRRNLQKAEKRLPVKGIKLMNLQDYFKQVFVPARKGREVTEIRYISDTYIKAVQVRENQGDIVYYYFNKIGNKWMVHLPTNEELN